MLTTINNKKKGNGKATDSLYDNNSIKVIIIGCIAIVVALLFMVITSMTIVDNAVILKLKTSDLKNMAGSIGSVVEGKIEKAVDASILLANDPAIANWVESKDEDQEYGEMVKNKMSELVNSFGYDTSFLVNADTFNYWSYDANKFRLLDVVSKEDKDDRWFFNTIGMKKKYEINIDPNKELKDTFVWINTLVGDVSHPIAVSGLGMNLSKVINDLVAEEAKNGIKSDIWLVDGKGVIYLSKNPQYLEKRLQDYLPSTLMEVIETEQPVQENSYEIAEYMGKDGKLYDIAYKKIMNTDWRLMVQIPRSESLGFMDAVTVNIIISFFIIILLMIAIFFILSNKIANPYKRALQLNQELEKKVEDRTRELQDKNTKIQDSIEYAKMIQDTMIPSSAEMKMIFKDYFIVSQPRDIVGGDFYWIKNINGGFLLVVGDCTGHGVPGALMTTAVNAMLNQIVDELNNINPAVILGELDRLVKQSFGKDGSEERIQYGLDAGVVYVSKDKGILYSGANTSLIIKDADGTREIKGQAGTIDCSNRNRKKKFANTEFDYVPGIALYIATDGITDQPGGLKLLPYGKSRLKSSIEAVSHMDMKLQAIQIMDTFKKYSGNEILRDDITLVGFKL